jgi:hypothetical protein
MWGVSFSGHTTGRVYTGAGAGACNEMRRAGMRWEQTGLRGKPRDQVTPTAQTDRKDSEPVKCNLFGGIHGVPPVTPFTAPNVED